MSKDLNEVLNYMKQYVENKYEHDSEPMLNYKDLQLVLEEIKRLNNIIKEVRAKLYDLNYKIKEIYNVPFDISEIFEMIEILDKVGSVKE